MLAHHTADEGNPEHRKNSYSPQANSKERVGITVLKDLSPFLPQRDARMAAGHQKVLDVTSCQSNACPNHSGVSPRVHWDDRDIFKKENHECG